MKLSDVMSAMHLEMYAEVALVIFLSVFVLVLFQVLRRNDERWQRASALPLADEARRIDQNHEQATEIRQS